MFYQKVPIRARSQCLRPEPIFAADKYNNFCVLKNDDSSTILVFSVQAYFGVSLHMHYQHKSGPFLEFSFHNFEDHNYFDATWCSGLNILQSRNSMKIRGSKQHLKYWQFPHAVRSSAPWNGSVI